MNFILFDELLPICSNILLKIKPVIFIYIYIYYLSITNKWNEIEIKYCVMFVIINKIKYVQLEF